MHYIPLIEVKDFNALIDNKLTRKKNNDKTKQNKTKSK